MTSKQVRLEIRRRLNGTKAGKGIVNLNDTSEQIEMKRARSAIRCFHVVYRRHGIPEELREEAMNRCRRFDRAMNACGIKLGCSAPLVS